MDQIKKILVIEDAKDWRDQIREYLEESNYKVDVADDLESALEKMRHNIYHLITVDMQLDENTTTANEYEGWNILDEVIKQGKGKSIPTLVITGFDKDYKELKDIKKRYGTYFLPKREFDKATFIKYVKMATEYTELKFKTD